MHFKKITYLKYSKIKELQRRKFLRFDLYKAATLRIKFIHDKRALYARYLFFSHKKYILCQRQTQNSHDSLTININEANCSAQAR